MRWRRTRTADEAAALRKAWSCCWALQGQRHAMAEKAPPQQLKLFDSMTRRKEPFQPAVDGKVSMYVCCVTPYDFSHIGNCRVYVIFDVLYRAVS